MILAIDTAGPWVAVAAGDRRREAPCEARIPAALNHNEELARLVDRILGQAGVTRPDLIAVDVGPGSFTGTRVGVSFAVGLAQGWRTSVFCASIFEVAATLAPDTEPQLAVALPIVRGSWCRATLDRLNGVLKETELAEIAEEDVRDGIGEMPLIIPWGRGHGPGAVIPPTDWSPAKALWELAASADGRGAVPPRQVAVRYVGPSQAERNFHARRGRA